MNNYKLIGSFFSLMILNTICFGQYVLPNYQSQIVNNNKLLIRWEPKNIAEWKTSMENGYEVKIFMGTQKDNLILKQTQVIKPASKEEWKLAINRQTDTMMQEFYVGAKRLIYLEEDFAKAIGENLIPEDGMTKEEAIAESRLGFLLYTSTYGMEIIELSGLGLSIDLEKGYIYRVEVSAKYNDSHEFYYDPSVKLDLSVPDMEAVFSNKKAMLKWSTPDYKKHFYGYNIYRSSNGEKYKKLNKTPFVNIFDTISTNKDAQYLTQELKLEKNYKNYWFQLKGMNYFGLESTLSSIEKGYGFEEINVMPGISYSNQTEDNHAEIRWNLDKTYSRLIDRIAVYRADERDGEYTVVMDSLAAGARSVRVPMEAPRNFYKIGVIPKDGAVIKSFPVFVMGQDTVAPITPQNFVGVIDSMGIATFTWDRNTEEDLWGYKVFRSEYIEDEFGPIQSSPILDTFFVDSVNLHSINDQIHYTIIALDKRNNRSDFATVISLTRPDTLPPTPPLVREVKFTKGAINVHWAPSSSDDVKVHQLFKKKYQENGWTLIAEIRGAERSYVDTDFEENKIYAYTMVAVDKSDLSSSPSKAMKVKTSSRSTIKEAFSSFDVDFDEAESQSSIRWNLKSNTELEEIIVYRGKTETDMSMYKIVEPESEKIIQDFKDSKQWFFVFKPIYKDDSLSRISDVISVQKPE